MYGEDIKRLEIECRDHRPLEVTAQTRCPQQPLSGAWRTLSSSECRSGIRTAQESQDGAVFPEEDSPPASMLRTFYRGVFESLWMLSISAGFSRGRLSDQNRGYRWSLGSREGHRTVQEHCQSCCRSRLLILSTPSHSLPKLWELLNVSEPTKEEAADSNNSWNIHTRVTV